MASNERRRAAIGRASADRRGFKFKFLQVFVWKINATHRGVFFHVANDVGQLERDAATLGQPLGVGIVISENLDADQSHHRGHVIAVQVKIFEGAVLHDQAGDGRDPAAARKDLPGRLRARPSTCRRPTGRATPMGSDIAAALSVNARSTGSSVGSPACA